MISARVMIFFLLLVLVGQLSQAESKGRWCKTFEGVRVFTLKDCEYYSLPDSQRDRANYREYFEHLEEESDKRTQEKIEQTPIESPLQIPDRGYSQPQIESTSRSMGWEACQNFAIGAGSQFGFPSLIFDTEQLKSYRIKTIDGSVVISCSRLDRKMVITKSPYQ